MWYTWTKLKKVTEPRWQVSVYLGKKTWCLVGIYTRERAEQEARVLRSKGYRVDVVQR